MASRSRIPERLRTVDWEELVPRLLLVATRFHRRYLVSYREAPEPEELVQEAVTDLLTGVRTLPAQVPVFIVLHETIRSIVTNFTNRHQALGQSTPVHRYVELESIQEQSTEHITTHTPDPAFQRAVRAEVQGDPLLEQIIDLLLEDPHLKAVDLAVMLKVDIKEIYKANRRLKRRLAPLRTQY